jgi:hypothetical protein
MMDSASYFMRMAPGLPGSSPARIAIPVGAGTATQLLVPTPAGFASGQFKFISMKVLATTFGTQAQVAVAFGPSTVAAPTAADPTFDVNDSWQDMILGPGQTHVNLFGSGTGFVYFWIRGI